MKNEENNSITMLCFIWLPTHFVTSALEGISEKECVEIELPNDWLFF